MTISEKKKLRDLARDRRAAAARKSPDAAERLRELLLSAIPIADGTAVAGFWPMGDEIDLRPALRAYLDRGHPVCLPVVARRNEPLIFRAWTAETVLEPAGFGTSEPPAGALEIVPDILFVPLLAFDRRGTRLGYGGGYYDRTLATLREVKPVLAVGVAYAAQELPCVPREAHDQPLDWIATEQGAWRIAR